MTNETILLFMVCILFIWLRKKARAAQMQCNKEVRQTIRPVVETGDGLTEDELLALITAAIAEYEGTNELQVLKIRPSNRHWQIAGRLEQMRQCG